MAQVYSQNAVGYINLSIPSGFSMIANQLVAPSYTLNALIPNPPPGTQVFKFSNVSGYSSSTFDEFDLVWSPNGNATLGLGSGAFINATAAFTLTFVGEVPQGSPITPSTPTPTGFSIVSSQVPQAGKVSTDLKLTAGPGDTVFRFSNASGYSSANFDEFDLVWSPSEPSVNVGEAFFLLRQSGSPATWSRTFNVN